MTRVVMPLVSEAYGDPGPGECPHFLDEPVVQIPGPLAREEISDFVWSVNELPSVSPAGIDRVSQRYFRRIAGIQGIFGEAQLLHRTFAC